jgi:hypothetical protein
MCPVTSNGAAAYIERGNSFGACLNGAPVSSYYRRHHLLFIFAEMERDRERIEGELTILFEDGKPASRTPS